MIQSLNRFLDIRCPQRRPNSIGKRKHNRHKRYRLEYKRRHTKPTYTQNNIYQQPTQHIASSKRDKQGGKRNSPSIRAPILHNPLLLLLLIPPLQLKISLMLSRPNLLPLHIHIQHRPDNRHEIQRQQQQRPEKRLRRNLNPQRPFDHRPKPRNRISSSATATTAAGFLEFSSLSNKPLVAPRHQRPVKGIQERILEQERAREVIRDRGAFAEDQDRGGDGG